MGENEGDVGEYRGLVGEYPGDVRLRAGDVGEYVGEVAPWPRSKNGEVAYGEVPIGDVAPANGDCAK